jgi:hypothetical protein
MAKKSFPTPPNAHAQSPASQTPRLSNVAAMTLFGRVCQRKRTRRGGRARSRREINPRRKPKERESSGRCSWVLFP